MTPLIAAIFERHMEMVELLVEHGANVDAENEKEVGENLWKLQKRLFYTGRRRKRINKIYCMKGLIEDC